MSPPEWVTKKLGPFLQATPGRSFLVVEGQDDLDVYGRALERLAAAPGTNPNAVQVEFAGSKWAVLKGLTWLSAAEGVAWVQGLGGDPSRIVGIADRDDWDAATVKERRKALPRLRVNEHRHCLESYFCDPQEIGEALAAKDADRYRAPCEALRDGVLDSLPDWVPHWALWVTLQRACHRLTLDESFPHAFYNQHPLPKDGQIKQQLQAWAKVFNPGDLFTAFAGERGAALRRKHHSQLRSCVHGKDFFQQVVLPQLRHCDGAVPPEDWMVRLVEWWPALPKDLQDILHGLL